MKHEERLQSPLGRDDTGFQPVSVQRQDYRQKPLYFRQLLDILIEYTARLAYSDFLNVETRFKNSKYSGSTLGVSRNLVENVSIIF